MKNNFKDLATNFVLKYGVIVALLILIVVFSLTTRAFFTVDNLFDILRAVSILTIVAIGVTFSVVVNGMDVSVGAVTGLAVILSTALMVIWQIPWYWVIIICLLAGAGIGLFNSLLIMRLRIPDLLATLGTLYLVQGLQMWITKGDAVYRGMTNPWSPIREVTKGFIPKQFLVLGQGFVFKTESFRGIPVPVIVMLFVAVIAWFFLDFTRYGRAFYAVGGNMEAARLAGIPVRKYRTIAYMISALLATLGGLVLASRIGSGAVKAGDPYLLDAVASTYFGFAVLGLRKPNVWGTFLGAVFVGVMLNGLTMLNVPWYIQDFIKGLVLVSALGISFAIKKESR
ncbi:MAG TPA: ABC transporter permease [Pseudothermotoga sp.]|nr:ABC transporter permease [Pseudothermotoga sp.]HOK83986.1 ABC transporter permease [Pseudothermotoga sp.]HPP70969.1 ABC transporter permease [Pseudothermotoga sp.]